MVLPRCCIFLRYPLQGCDVGKYRDTPGAASCLDCGAGKYSDAASSTACTNCGAGKYNDATEGNTAENRCSGCPDNKYTASGGATSSAACTICKPGYYAGNSACAVMSHPLAT